MGLRQFSVVLSCAALGFTLWILPRNTVIAKESAFKKGKQEENELSNQIAKIKEELPSEQTSRINFFENQLNQASSQEEKIVWLDSLISIWDKNMRPGISAEFSFKKADMTNSSADWVLSGKRFIGLSRFFDDATQKQQLLEKSVECFNSAYQKDSLNEEVNVMLGVASVESGKNPMKGISLLKKIADNNPMNFDAQLNLGIFSMQSGQYDKAIARFKKSIQIKKDQPEVYFLLSDALSQLGKNKEAIEELETAKKIFKDPAIVQETEKRIQQIQHN